MTYIEYINQFWKMNRSVEFSSNEVFLYFYLLNECNIRGWQNPFEHPNKTIVLATGISEKTVIEVRNRLQQKRVGELFPADSFFDKSLDDCYTELKSNRSWAETVTMNTRSSGYDEFTIEAFYECLKQFFMKLQNEGETTKSPKGAMSHFARWLKLELSNKKDGKSKRTDTDSETKIKVRTIKL